MNAITEMFFLGFLIGLTGALAPGPTTIATINASLKGGWTMGPRVTLGHAVVEVVMVLLIIAGLSVIIGGYSWLIAGIGGASLVVFGVLTVMESRYAQFDLMPEVPQDPRMAASPFLSGIITSISNPYFWLWWFTVGSALMIGALSGGIPTAIAFITGHWGADLACLTLVSTSVHYGRFLLSDRQYRWILALCGLFLIVFGVYYVLTLLR